MDRKQSCIGASLNVSSLGVGAPRCETWPGIEAIECQWLAQRPHRAIIGKRSAYAYLTDPRLAQSGSDAKRRHRMKLDEWLTRLTAVPPGQSPLAYGIAIGMRIAMFILVPLAIIAAVAILLLHR